MSSPHRGDFDESEYRQRVLHVFNRSEELAAKYGRPPPEVPRGEQLDPSWGEVGLLARRWLSSAEVERLIRLDEQLALSERQR